MPLCGCLEHLICSSW